MPQHEAAGTPDEPAAGSTPGGTPPPPPAPRDERPRPQYGEYAPEGWTWQPPADAHAADPAPPQPHAGHAAAAGSPAPRRPRRRPRRLDGIAPRCGPPPSLRRDDPAAGDRHAAAPGSRSACCRRCRSRCELLAHARRASSPTRPGPRSPAILTRLDRAGAHLGRRPRRGRSRSCARAGSRSGCRSRRGVVAIVLFVRSSPWSLSERPGAHRAVTHARRA